MLLSSIKRTIWPKTTYATALPSPAPASSFVWADYNISGEKEALWSFCVTLNEKVVQTDTLEKEGKNNGNAALYPH